MDLADFVIAPKNSKKPLRSSDKLHVLKGRSHPVPPFSRTVATKPADQPLAPLAREYAKIIASCGTMLGGLINDILDFSKIAAGKVVLKSSRTSIRALMLDIAQVMRSTYRPPPSSTRVQFGVHLDGSVPRQSVDVDEVRLRQIIVNVVSNALKFTDEGSVTVSVSCTSLTNKAIGKSVEKQGDSTRLGASAERRSGGNEAAAGDAPATSGCSGKGLPGRCCHGWRICEKLSGSGVSPDEGSNGRSSRSSSSISSTSITGSGIATKTRRGRRWWHHLQQVRGIDVDSPLEDAMRGTYLGEISSRSSMGTQGCAAANDDDGNDSGSDDNNGNSSNISSSSSKRTAPRKHGGQRLARLTITVCDTGIGIAPDVLDQLFNPFVQGNRTERSLAVGGTGLGLAISKSLCQLMGGGISCASEHDRGTTFKFSVLVGLGTGEDDSDGLFGQRPPAQEDAELVLSLEEGGGGGAGQAEEVADAMSGVRVNVEDGSEEEGGGQSWAWDLSDRRLFNGDTDARGREGGGGGDAITIPAIENNEAVEALLAAAGGRSGCGNVRQMRRPYSSQSSKYNDDDDDTNTLETLSTLSNSAIKPIPADASTWGAPPSPRIDAGTTSSSLSSSSPSSSSSSITPSRRVPPPLRGSKERRGIPTAPPLQFSRETSPLSPDGCGPALPAVHDLPKDSTARRHGHRRTLPSAAGYTTVPGMPSTGEKSTTVVQPRRQEREISAVGGGEGEGSDSGGLVVGGKNVVTEKMST